MSSTGDGITHLPGILGSKSGIKLKLTTIMKLHATMKLFIKRRKLKTSTTWPSDLGIFYKPKILSLLRSVYIGGYVTAKQKFRVSHMTRVVSSSLFLKCRFRLKVGIILNFHLKIGFIHIVRMYKGGREHKGEGGSRLRTYTKKILLDHKISKLFFFCTKEAIILPFVAVHRKV